MLRGELTGLRAPTDTDIEVFETELLTDVETRIRATGHLAGEAVLSGIDLHNRRAEIGLVLRPAFRGRYLGTDVVRVLCHYGFVIRGLHRLQITTLAGNQVMIAAAVRSGFVLEGTARECAWLDGAFADGVTLSLLFSEWRADHDPSSTKPGSS